MTTENKDRVKSYHNKLANIRVRVPSEEVAGIDYVKIFKNQASKKGLSLNAYILDLIEKDIRADDSAFTIAKGVKELKD